MSDGIGWGRGPLLWGGGVGGATPRTFVTLNLKKVHFGGSVIPF